MLPSIRLLFTLLLALWLAGCDFAADRAIVVEFWAMGQEGEQVKALLPEFERRHPGLRVRVQQIPWSAAHEKLLTAYAGDAMPDLFQLGNTWIPEFVALRAVEPLDPRLKTWPETALNDYFPGILATNRLNGQTYALPWYVDTRLFFYRTDLLAAAGFAEPPAAWDDWLRAMTAIKAAGGSARHAILLPINEWQLPVILALQRGASLLRDHDQYGNFQDPRFREAFVFYLRLFEQGLAPPVGNTQMANLYQEFASGAFAIYVSGPWNIGEFGRRLPAAVQGQWMTAALPGSGAEPGVSLAGGASLALSRTSPRQAAAWALLEFLAEPEQQARFYQLTGDLPARQSAWTDPALAGNRYAQAFQQQLQHVKATPQIPEWERIANKLAYHAERAIRGQVSADEALAALDRDVDRILEKRRWLLSRSVQPSPPASRRGRGARKMKGSERHAALSAGIFLAPALLLIAVFFFLPVLAALLLSFTDFDIYALGDLARLRFVGFNNYLQLLQSPLFWTALGNTFYFVIVGGPLSVAISLGAALLVNAHLTRFPSFFRAAFFLPVVTTLVAVAVVWRYLYHPRYGLLNYGLSLLGIEPIDWLGDPDWAMPAIILMAVWKNFGFNMIIFIAGLQNIPTQLYEAARIDGASAWRQFRYITLPLLGPTFLFVALMTMIGYFQVFAEPYVMTQGGPANRTLSVVLLMYEEGFRWWNMGYASAAAFVLFVLILAGTVLQLKLRRGEPP